MAIVRREPPGSWPPNRSKEIPRRKDSLQKKAYAQTGVPGKIITTALVVFLALAYLRGLFIPLMNYNAAHHANIALHMYLTGDYVNLIDQGQDYLDKPHLLFWLAALGYHLFGVSAFAYKVFSFAFVLVGIYATYRLGRLVFDERTGRYAAGVLSSAFAFILSTNDVRMDAMVVSCIAFATWQLFAYFFNRQRGALFLGALGLALGFATKGAVAVALPVMATGFYFVQQGQLRGLFTARWLALAGLTLLLLAPLFYCFYLQFDLHPEKVIRGRAGNSGIWFLLLGQSVQRYTGSGWGERSSDPFFLLHTFLWAFLPWCLLGYAALARNLGRWVRARLRFRGGPELAFTATIFVIFALVSFSRFKNAHYINILFPYFSIITAEYVRSVGARHQETLWRIQLALSVLLVAGMTTINTWFFPLSGVLVAAGAVLLGALFVVTATRKGISLEAKTFWTPFAAVVYSFFLLHFNFYPKLLPYQSGQGLARQIRQRHIDPRHLYYIEGGEKNFSLEFSLATLARVVPADSLRHLPEPAYLFGSTRELETLRQQQVPFDTVLQAPHYNVTTLKYQFLNPKTRHRALTPHYVVRLRTGQAGTQRQAARGRPHSATTRI